MDHPDVLRGAARVILCVNTQLRSQLNEVIESKFGNFDGNRVASLYS